MDTPIPFTVDDALGFFSAGVAVGMAIIMLSVTVITFIHVRRARRLVETNRRIGRSILHRI